MSTIININTFLFITNIFIFLFSGLMMIVTPRLTRKSLLFGVRIPLDVLSRSEVKELKSRYIRVCIGGTILLLIVCVVQYLLFPDKTILATLYFPLLLAPIYYIAFIPNWRAALELKEKHGWTVPSVSYADTTSSHSRGNLSTMPWVWYVVSLVLILITAIISIVRYPLLPDMIPSHFNEGFQATSYMDKTLLNVLMMPLINIATFVLMVACGIGIEKAKLQIDQSKPRLSFAQHRVYRRRVGNSIGFLTLAITITMAVMGLPMLYPESTVFTTTLFWIVMGLIMIPTVYAVVVMFRTGQGGSKVRIDISGDGDSEQLDAAAQATFPGRNDDKYWKLGTFYYNPDDPAFIVGDRFGTNIGFNYATLPAKILVAVTALGIIAVYVWVTLSIPALIA